MMKEEHAKSVNSRIFPGIQGGPLMHTIAAKAIAFGEALDKRFQVYAQQVIRNAQVLSDEFLAAGLNIVSGGTDNHMLMLDLRPFDLTGSEAEEALGRAAITVNKNMIPNDPQPPRVTSGVRIGTPALTTRGFQEDEMKQVAAWIVKALKNSKDEAVLQKIRGEIKELTSRYPLWTWGG